MHCSKKFILLTGMKIVIQIVLNITFFDLLLRHNNPGIVDVIFVTIR